MPGIGEEIDGAMQQAPQPGRQVKGADMMDNTGAARQYTWRAAQRLDWHIPRVYIS